MIDVSELMSDPDFVKSVVVRRTRPGTFVSEGEYQHGPPVDFPVLMAVQPPKGSEVMNLLPEGARKTSIKKLFCGQPLQVADGSKAQADLVTFCDKTYKVIKCDPWEDSGYWLAFAEEVTS